ncbi:MarR family transcriptional regulator [Aeromicrobium sp. 636]|uniref:MarR family transcriptional regulator n=1 Tax=Aeromicrobium senzhongii TaxID=2663859 RepID=A0A8I0K067_9ACTN|nr:MULTISPECIES: MarR family transcriptional regulator [Aeromicrobium]MBC9226041.1 MarR family transcriptional regulator [Aeromicrobium senzhongii]MCQ3998148.1 MarR family transcriptional regulator [Aeromicrobium sp. 636]MTB88576.1 MarR family transcriptional regulator [Aeromicrobium senzhongii]QNL94111.1 MarR family transcriptional regulator [Aeromicrobium senzhongii]
MAGLDFDPIERAAQLWAERIGDATSMRLATSIMRVHQLLASRLDAALRPFGITFARYEVLRLLSFSSSGSLPLSKIGERLMVHPTSVTNVIDRLVADGLVDRRIDPSDRRRALASLTDAGRQVLDDATQALVAMDFGLDEISPGDQTTIHELLTPLRRGDWT